MGTGELLGKPNKLGEGGVTCDKLGSRPEGIEILLATSCYRDVSFSNYEPSGSKSSLFLLTNSIRNDVKHYMSESVAVFCKYST